jgi:hypothetical protein
LDLRFFISGSAVIFRACLNNKETEFSRKKLGFRANESTSPGGRLGASFGFMPYRSFSY